MASQFGWNYSERYYDRLLWLSYSGWAWEFRRRLPGLLTENRVSRSRPIRIGRQDGNDLIRMRSRCPRAENHGLHFLPDPRLSAYETPVFWLPEVMTTNLNAASEIGSRFTRSGEQLPLGDIPGKKSILVTPGRRTKLAVTARGYSAHLAIDTRGARIPISFYLTLKANAGAELIQKLECFERFARFCAGLEFEFSARRGYAPEALRRALIALDGHLSGAPRREIASAIFDKDLVAEDWESGVNSYKQRTKRLVDKGLKLMHTDYLKLL